MISIKDEREILDVYSVTVDRYFQRTTKIWKVNRVRLETNLGVVVYRPYKEKKVFREIDGKKICLTSKEQIHTGELPTKILEVSHLAIENGVCKVKLAVRSIKREGTTYLYLRGEDLDAELEILPITEKVGSD